MGFIDNYMYKKIRDEITKRFNYAKTYIVDGELIIEIPYEVYDQSYFQGIDVVGPNEYKKLNINEVKYVIDYKGNEYFKPHFKSFISDKTTLIIKNAVINSSSEEDRDDYLLDSVIYESCRLFDEGTLKVKCRHIEFRDINVTNRQKVILDNGNESIEYRLLKGKYNVFLGNDKEFNVSEKLGATIIEVVKDIPAEKVSSYIDAYELDIDVSKYTFNPLLSSFKTVKTTIVLYKDLEFVVQDFEFITNLSVYSLKTPNRFVKSEIGPNYFETYLSQTSEKKWVVNITEGDDSDYECSLHSREYILSYPDFIKASNDFLECVDEAQNILDVILDEKIKKYLQLLREKNQIISLKYNGGKEKIYSEKYAADIENNVINLRIYNAVIFEKLQKDFNSKGITLQKNKLIFDADGKWLGRQTYIQYNDDIRKIRYSICNADSKLLLVIDDDISKTEYIFKYGHKYGNPTYSLIKSNYDDEGTIINSKSYPAFDNFNGDERYIKYYFLTDLEFKMEMEKISEYIKSLINIYDDGDKIKKIFEYINVIKLNSKKL